MGCVWGGGAREGGVGRGISAYLCLLNTVFNKLTLCTHVCTHTPARAFAITVRLWNGGRGRRRSMSTNVLFTLLQYLKFLHLFLALRVPYSVYCANACHNVVV
jgi:hypothetical protein